MRKFSKKKSALAVLLIFNSTQLLAQEETIGFSAEAEIKLKHDDNIYRTTDELAVSDSLITLTPQLTAGTAIGKHNLQVSYKGNYSKHFDLSDADYDDHQVTARVNLDHSHRFKTQFDAVYLNKHQDPGSLNRVRQDITEYYLFEETWYQAKASYGTEESIGAIELAYRYSDRDNTNNGLDYLDHTSDRIIGRFVFRASPRTRVYAEAIFTETDYTPPPGFAELDNTDWIYRAGVRWNFANKLTGDVNLGYQDRNFDEEFRDTSGLTYDASVNWKLSGLTTLDVAASRQAVDSTIEDIGSFTVNAYSARLRHEFTERLMFKTILKFADEEIAANSRSDKRYVAEVGAEYEVLPRVTLGTNYSFSKRSSSFELAEFESNVISINVKVQMD